MLNLINFLVFQHLIEEAKENQMISQIFIQQNVFARKFHSGMNYHNFEVNIFKNYQSL